MGMDGWEEGASSSPPSLTSYLSSERSDSQSVEGPRFAGGGKGEAGVIVGGNRFEDCNFLNSGYTNPPTSRVYLVVSWGVTESFG